MDEGDQRHGNQGLAREQEYQANERTYLAWLRTALSVMALGVAVGNLRTSPYAYAAAAVLIVAGTVGLIFGTKRYRRVQREIRRGFLVTGTRGRAAETAAVVLAVAILAALSLLILDGLSH
jgi:putative membrane protein